MTTVTDKQIETVYGEMPNALKKMIQKEMLNNSTLTAQLREVLEKTNLEKWKLCTEQEKTDSVKKLIARPAVVFSSTGYVHDAIIDTIAENESNNESSDEESSDDDSSDEVPSNIVKKHQSSKKSSDDDDDEDEEASSSTRKVSITTTKKATHSSSASHASSLKTVAIPRPNDDNDEDLQLALALSRSDMQLGKPVTKTAFLRNQLKNAEEEERQSKIARSRNSWFENSQETQVTFPPNKDVTYPSGSSFTHGTSYNNCTVNIDNSVHNHFGSVPPNVSIRPMGGPLTPIRDGLF